MVLGAILLFIFMVMTPTIYPNNNTGKSVGNHQLLFSNEKKSRVNVFDRNENGGNLNPIWGKTYDNAWATSIKGCNGYIYVAGSVNRKPKEENDVILLKYDTDGNLIWSKTWDKYPYDAAWGIDVHDGYVYLAGYGSDWHSAITYSNIFILKYDTDGNLIWSKDYNKATYDFAYSIVVEGNNIYVGGQSNCESLLLKYDLDGNLEWDKTYGKSREMYSEIMHLSSCDGYIYAVGQTEDSRGDDDILLLKYDSDGNLIWDTTWEITGTQRAYGIKADSESVYIAGFGDIVDADATGLLLKYNDKGELIWQTSFEHFKLEDVEEWEGNIYVVGQTTGNSPYPSDWDIVIAKFDSDGKVIDFDVVYTAGCDIARDVDVFEGSLYVSGSQENKALIMKFGEFFEKTNYDEDETFSTSRQLSEHNVCATISKDVIKSAHKSIGCGLDSLEVAIGTADWLISLAETTSNGYKWPINEEEKEYSTDLYDGVPGVCLFLLGVYEATGEKIYREYAEGGMNWLMSTAVSAGGGYKWPETEKSSQYLTGYYEGAAGIGKVFLDFYQSLGDSKYLEYAEGAARWIKSVDGIRRGHEMMRGAAGIGEFFLKLYDVTGDSQYLSYAKRGGDWLISNAQECPILFLTEMGNPLHRSSPIKDGCLWVTIPLYWITSTGFAHGTSAPVYFLSELYKRCGEQKYLDCAVKAVRWIIHEAVIEGDGDMQWRWKYRLDQLQSPFLFATGWCYGIPGIGNAFMLLYEATGDSQYLEILKRGTDWIIEQAIPDEGGYRWIGWVPRVETKFGGSITQRCCGVAAVGYYLLDLFDFTNNPLYLKYGLGAVEWLKNVAVKTPKGYKWWLTTHSRVAYTGHHTGAAGIGLLLLRAHEMNKPPNTPNKPSGPTSGKVGKEYTYTTSAVDPDGNKISYGWDWDGDMTVDEWTPLYISGEIIEISHSWSQRGTYNVRVKAKDEFGLESEWSDPLVVSMPKSYKNPVVALIQKINEWMMQAFGKELFPSF